MENEGATGESKLSKTKYLPSESSLFLKFSYNPSTKSPNKLTNGADKYSLATSATVQQAPIYDHIPVQVDKLDRVSSETELKLYNKHRYSVSDDHLASSVNGQQPQDYNIFQKRLEKSSVRSRQRYDKLQSSVNINSLASSSAVGQQHSYNKLGTSLKDNHILSPSEAGHQPLGHDKLLASDANYDNPMSTAILPQFSLQSFYPGNLMSTPNEDLYAATTLKKCNTDSYANDLREQPYFGAAQNPGMVGGDSLEVPEQLITLSYDLLNQIQRHEQQDCESGEVMGVSDITSQVEINYKSVKSASADSSSYRYGFNELYTEMADDPTSLSSLSSPTDSIAYSADSPCDSVPSKNKASLVTKPLYTAELQVLCRICGDRASGYHYGVHSCEGCKGFFRRTLKKDLVYKPCRESAQCRIDTGTRNKCQYCRYQKCLNAGMSQNAVRFGRMPKAEREKLIADKEELSKNTRSRIMELRSLSDCIKGAFVDCFSSSGFICHYLQHNVKKGIQIKADPECRFNTETLTTQTFTEQNIFHYFQNTIIPVIEGTVKFTKKIPTFSNLGMVDRITLLKQNCFCVPLILSYLMCDNSSLFLDSENTSLSITNSHGQFICWEAQSLLEGMFQIAHKLTNMQLKIVEVSLFCAAVLLIESPGLTDYSEVEELQMELLNSLRLELKHNHPKDRYLFPRLLVLIPQLVQVTEEFRTNLKNRLFDNSPNLSSTHELLVELFDLR